MGFEKLITTPHTMSHRYPNTKAQILSARDAMREHIEREGVGVELDAASEYYLDLHFLSLVERGEVLTFGDDMLLFEISYLCAPLELEEMVFRMTGAGYRPVLAHPERYLYLRETPEVLPRLKEMGVLMQVNVNSLQGYYSESVKRFAERIAREGLIDFLGSDTHHLQHIESLENAFSDGIVQEVMKRNRIMNDSLRENG